MREVFNSRVLTAIQELMRATAESRITWTPLPDDGISAVVGHTRVRIGWAIAFDDSDSISIDRQALFLSMGPVHFFCVWNTATADELVDLLKLVDQRWSKHFDYIARWETVVKKSLQSGVRGVSRSRKFGFNHLKLLQEIFQSTSQDALKWRRVGRSGAVFECKTSDGQELLLERVFAQGYPKGNRIPFTRVSVPGAVVSAASGTDAMYIAEQILALISPKFSQELRRRDRAVERLIASLQGGLRRKPATSIAKPTRGMKVV